MARHMEAGGENQDKHGRCGKVGLCRAAAWFEFA